MPSIAPGIFVTMYKIPSFHTALLKYTLLASRPPDRVTVTLQYMFTVQTLQGIGIAFS